MGGQCTNLIHKVANVIHEEWTATGCVYTLELSKADLNSLQVALMKPTNGDYEIAFLDEDGQQQGAEDAAPAMNASQRNKQKKRDAKKKKKKDKAQAQAAHGSQADAKKKK